MDDLRAVGSEFLKGQEKLNRILDLCGINENQERTTIEHNKVEFVKQANNGITYAIVKENQAYFVKNTEKQTDIQESDFQYIGGEQYNTKFKFRGYSDALKSLNNLFNTINEERGIKEQVNLFSVNTEEKKKP